MAKNWQMYMPWWHSPLCMKVWMVSWPNDSAIPTSPCFPEITGNWEKPLETGKGQMPSNYFL